MDKRKIVDFLTTILLSFFGKKDKERNYFLKSVCKSVEKYSDKFITYRERYKFAASNKKIENFSVINEECAIIIQGPIRTKDNFTLETVKLYKRYYPNTLIILSTWDDIDNNTEELFKGEGIEILKNKKPLVTGLGNVNFQLISTMKGIELAKEKKCKYILKTRSDQRIYKIYFLEYFLGLIRHFNLESSITGQKARIITGPSIVRGSMFKPYMISDFIYFGGTEDIEKIFSVELDKTNMTVKERDDWINTLIGKYTIKEYFEKTAPELHLIKNFADKVMDTGSELTIKSYWEFVKNHLICLGWEDINLFWPKYAIYNEAKIDSSITDTNFETDLYNWNFTQWLLLYNESIKYKEEYEKYSQEIKF